MRLAASYKLFLFTYLEFIELTLNYMLSNAVAFKKQITIIKII